MQQFYLGFKTIAATPMTRLAYNQYRGWALPTDENPDDPGYLVEYLDGGQANDPRHQGYISWSPQEVFENAYKASGSMSFGMALEALKKGHRVARSGWNGKGMWLSYVQGQSERGFLPYLQMKTVADQYVPWLASQTDMLADDWMILEGV